eukprot:CAMPEP_0169449684 /NCGR_PEP_ID=MMETSP1042-20121227/12746_1 /TAXON_ID=464988 /ORGANISM="Hemiselmis andersenii, Strain CCMP1180" /LENGTH=145 /DNA_ID=CAMNT_0009561447 /DNA_START=237 /DNA_END=670 /DNA_ORIENTATION=+
MTVSSCFWQSPLVPPLSKKPCVSLAYTSNVLWVLTGMSSIVTSTLARSEGLMRPTAVSPVEMVIRPLGCVALMPHERTIVYDTPTERSLFSPFLLMSRSPRGLSLTIGMLYASGYSRCFSSLHSGLVTAADDSTTSRGSSPSSPS